MENNLIANESLCLKAVEMMSHAYVPYSHHTVGAALLTVSGEVFTGCNIENAAYGPTVCGERTAIFKAISEGHKDFVRIAVAGGPNGKIEGFYPPCGVCRQVMAEFCKEDFEILVVTSADPVCYKVYKLSEILPYAFTPDHLDMNAI